MFKFQYISPQSKFIIYSLAMKFLYRECTFNVREGGEKVGIEGRMKRRRWGREEGRGI